MSGGSVFSKKVVPTVGSGSLGCNISTERSLDITRLGRLPTERSITERHWYKIRTTLSLDLGALLCGHTKVTVYNYVPDLPLPCRYCHVYDL